MSRYVLLWPYSAGTPEDAAGMALLTLLKNFDVIEEYVIFESGLDAYDYLDLQLKGNK